MPDLMTIVSYPDPFLRRRAEDIEEINDSIRETVARMLDTMYASHGVGLAGPQVGISQRIVVFNPTGEEADERVLINPRIVEHRGAMEGEEGCLSFPEVAGMVRRSSHVKILAYDLEGNDLEVTATDFLARVLQHEVDHLDGTLFIDRMTPESRVRVREALRALEEDFGRGPEEGRGRS
jgi:peptide deformylase